MAVADNSMSTAPEAVEGQEIEPPSLTTMHGPRLFSVRSRVVMVAVPGANARSCPNV